MFRDSYGWSMPPITISSNAGQRAYSGDQLHSRHQRDWDPPLPIQLPSGFRTRIMDALDQLAHMKKLHISFTDIRPGFVATPLLKDDKYPLLMHASLRGITNCKSHLPKEKSSCHRPALSDAGVFLETDSRMAMGEAACAEPIKHLAPKLRHCLTNLIRTKFIFLPERLFIISNLSLLL